MELVNATGGELSPQIPMPSMYKMIATVMLQNGFEPSFRLGRNSQGIIEPIMVLVKGARYGLGYIPMDDNLKTKEKNDQALVKRSHIYINPS